MNKFNDVIILEMGSEKGPSARIIYFLVRVIEMTFALNSIANKTLRALQLHDRYFDSQFVRSNVLWTFQTCKISNNLKSCVRSLFTEMIPNEKT